MEDDRVYHERHTKSTFEPLVPTKYEGDKLPENIPPILTTGKRGKVLPALNIDKSSPYYPPPPYMLMEKQGKKKKKRRSKRKVGNKDRDYDEEDSYKGTQTPPTQIQKDTAKMFQTASQGSQEVPKKLDVGPEKSYAKVHPTSMEQRGARNNFDFSFFSKSHPPPHRAMAADSKLQKVHPLPENGGNSGYEANMTSTPNSEAIHMQLSHPNGQRSHNRDRVNFESEL
jgi:hypothetical protein